MDKNIITIQKIDEITTTYPELAEILRLIANVQAGPGAAGVQVTINILNCFPREPSNAKRKHPVRWRMTYPKK